MRAAISWPRSGATAAAVSGDDAVSAAVTLLLFAIIVLQRFGLTVGTFSVSPTLPAVYALLLVALLRNVLTVSLLRLAVYVLCMAVAVTSTLLNETRTSYGSLLLIAVMYFPFAFTVSPGSTATQRRAVDVFLVLSAFCAVAGIVQFYLQFVVRPGWLFDFTPFVPEVLRGPTGYNTVIPVGAHYKSNGFLFREPSGFSFCMALALLLEHFTRRRWLRMTGFAWALLLSYSGTGLLALIIGLLMPPNRRAFARTLLFAGVALLLLTLLDPFLNLSFTLARLGEFHSERSSAYIRYVGPGRMLMDSLRSDEWTLWFGHGPGTVTHQQLPYEFHDPTWAKLLYEYGLIGFTLFTGLFVLILRRSAMPLAGRVVLFVAWMIMGGHLLSPEQTFLTFALVGLLPEQAWTPAGTQRTGQGSFGLPALAREGAR